MGSLLLDTWYQNIVSYQYTEFHLIIFKKLCCILLYRWTNIYIIGPLLTNIEIVFKFLLTQCSNKHLCLYILEF